MKNLIIILTLIAATWLLVALVALSAAFFLGAAALWIKSGEVWPLYDIAVPAGLIGVLTLAAIAQLVRGWS